MSTQPKGIHHIAIATRDIKTQIEFFTGVLGCKLKALYWMHGAEGAWHGFLELNPSCYFAFVQHPDNPQQVQIGVTHAGIPTGPLTVGGMQHVSFQLDSVEELLEMRDRIRSHGVMVVGPLDHGMCHSIYFAGPEGLCLEFAAGGNIDDRAWIDPEVVKLAGIDEADLARYRNPAEYQCPESPVPQPALDRTKPHLNYPDEIYEMFKQLSDDQLAELLSENQPPVKVEA